MPRRARATRLAGRVVQDAPRSSAACTSPRARSRARRARRSATSRGRRPAARGTRRRRAPSPGTASVAMPVVDARSSRAPARPRASAADAAEEAARPMRTSTTAGEQEEQHREQAVVDHLERRAGRALSLMTKIPSADQAHLRDRRVRDDAARVGLPEGDSEHQSRPIERERDEPAAEVVRRARGRAAARSAACRRRRPSRRRPRAVAATSGGASR